MIKSLLYLNASQAEIMFSTCLFAKIQDDPKMSHLLIVKQIFWYLRGTKGLRIWYPIANVFLF